MMENVIAVAACVWMVPFLVLERRCTGRAAYLSRLVGAAPFLILVALAWIDGFSQNAVFSCMAFVLVATMVADIVSWRQRRAAKGQTPGE